MNKELEKIAKEYSIPTSEVMATYKDFVADELTKGRNKKDSDKRATRRTQLFYKKTSIGGPTESIDLILVGSKEAMDSSFRSRAKAMEIWEENPQKAIAEGWCSEDGIPLDKLAEFPGGGKNKNYGKPMKVRFMRIVVGVSKAEKKLVTFIMNEKQATDMEIPLFCESTINGKKKKDGTYGSTKSTRVVCKDTTYIEDLEGVITKCIKNEITQIESIDEWVLDHDAKDVLVTIGDVLTIDMEPNSTGSRTVILDNGTDFGQRVFVPEHIPIYFGEQSRVILFGGAKPGKEDYGPAVTAMGLYAIPDFMYEPEGNDEYIDERIGQSEPADDTDDDLIGEPEVLPDENKDDPNAGKGDENPQPESTNAPEPDTKAVTPTLMINVIKSQDEGDGVLISEIIAQASSQGYNPDMVPIVLSNLVKSGELYEPKTGMIAITKTESVPAGW